MGSWNGTCGLTQRSIGASDKVVAYVILFNSNVVDDCYSQSIAQPISFPIHGRYNDYGCIEDVADTFGARSTLVMFNQWLSDNRLVTADRDALPAQFKSVEEIFTLIQLGMTVTLPHPYLKEGTETRTLGFQLNLKSATLSAWETLDNSKAYEMERTKWDFIRTSVQSVIDETINVPPMTEEEIEVELKTLIALKDSANDKRIQTLYGMHMAMLMAKDGHRFVWGDGNNDLTPKYGNSCRILHEHDYVHIGAFVTLFDITKVLYTTEQNEDIKTTIAQFIMTHHTMWVFRKNWSPQGHSSQFDNLEMSIEFTKRELKRMEAELAANVAARDDEEYEPNTFTHEENDYEIV